MPTRTDVKTWIIFLFFLFQNLVAIVRQWYIIYALSFMLDTSSQTCFQWFLANTELHSSSMYCSMWKLGQLRWYKALSGSRIFNLPMAWKDTHHRSSVDSLWCPCKQGYYIYNFIKNSIISENLSFNARLNALHPKFICTNIM